MHDRLIEMQIRDHITKNLVYSDSFEYDDSTSFIAEGLIDSMGIMDLLAYVSSEFGIAVELEDVTPDNFDSVNKIASFIRRKTETLSITALAAVASFGSV